MQLTSTTALFLVDVDHCTFLPVDVNHPALFYLVDGRRSFYSPFHLVRILLMLSQVFNLNINV